MRGERWTRVWLREEGERRETERGQNRRDDTNMHRQTNSLCFMPPPLSLLCSLWFIKPRVDGAKIITDAHFHPHLFSFIFHPVNTFKRRFISVFLSSFGPLSVFGFAAWSASIEEVCWTTEQRTQGRRRNGRFVADAQTRKQTDRHLFISVVPSRRRPEPGPLWSVKKATTDSWWGAAIKRVKTWAEHTPPPLPVIQDESTRLILVKSYMLRGGIAH